MDKTTVITLENLTRFANNATEKFVAKEEGKVLSSNDFTNDQKEKLEGLENYVLPQASAEVAGGIKVGAGSQDVTKIIKIYFFCIFFTHQFSPFNKAASLKFLWTQDMQPLS